MSYGEEIWIKCSKIADVQGVQVSPVENGFDIEISIKLEGRSLRQEQFLSTEAWDDLGEIGVAETVAKALELEVDRYYDNRS